MTRTICQATNRFYAEHAASFASTRQQAWHGWERLLPSLRTLPPSFTVLDAACGNMRFEHFLAGHGLHPAAAHAVDACPELLDSPGPDALRTNRICAALSIVLDDGADRFLGWQDAEDAFRFCHYFSDAECADLARFAEEHGARVLDSFCADGRTGDLNRYLVLQVD